MLYPSLLIPGKLFQLSQLLWDACRCHRRFAMRFKGRLTVELVPGECPIPHSHSEFSDFSDRFWGLADVFMP
ncbi:hypothetical protein PILCRDRAFT_826677 [Piloderma croceum F 1598]|uniref:Uncharacterized protein n=1 Tax=Piloderma croceum (strain F 1598) TaxID=765440 RepID=A0A0C3F7V8_PILCF|nr:hypothetical protein PILCRDRAFT_826677 [Piloderma croceum F 1598]